VEGETDDPTIKALRSKLIKNACAVLMCSRGTPMFNMGDEICNTQFGNNNPYCQDNEISWLDWGLLEKNQDIFEFFKFMIDFRKKHEVLRRKTAPCSCGFPEISFHGVKPWEPDFEPESRVIGVMFAGRDPSRGDDIVMVVINAHWEKHKIVLPDLPGHLRWVLEVDTGLGADCIPIEKKPIPGSDAEIRMKERSVAVFSATSIW